MIPWNWTLVEPGRLERRERAVADPAPGHVRVRVSGCGICHTDIGFLDGEVAPRAGLPIVLGHEVSGVVERAGPGAEGLAGKPVVVPSVISCGSCAACRAGRGNTCGAQFMPGNDGDGGFATHVTVPARGLAEVTALPEGLQLADLSVIADAVTTPLQALRRARVGSSDLVVVIGTGGVGTHAVQIAAALGARVIGIDVDEARLAALDGHGVSATIAARGMSVKDIRARVRDIARRLDAPPAGWKILECSGTTGGQETAWSLLGTGAVLAIVGFTREPVSLRLANLMAFDADAFGSWGCPVELYPEAIALVTSGAVALAPFVQHVPLEQLPDAIAAARTGAGGRRIVLVP